MIPQFVYIFLLGELAGVAYIDMKSRKIHNQWTLLNFFLFIALLFLAPGLYALQIQAIIYPFIFLTGGFFLYFLRIMGAGDVKFLSGLLLLIPFDLQNKFIETLFLVTIGISLLLFLIKAIELKDKQKWLQSIKQKRPFAPVILIAWCLFGFRIYL